MRTIENVNDINVMMTEKQALEVRLSWELLEVFNDPKMGLLSELHKMVRRSITVMDSIAKDINTKAQFESKWKKDWSKKYFSFGGEKKPPGIEGGVWNAQAIDDGVSTFIAQHCADWIRIFGEVVEDIVKGKSNEARLAFQKGDQYHWRKYDGKAQGGQMDKGRRRVLGQFRKDEIVMPDYSKTGTVWAFQRDITSSAGLNRWQVMQGDTTGKMDQVFGLMPGATISGTTTDNIYFYKRFGGLWMNPIFYLLPTATIVSGGHHSLLEVGLPLMLNNICKYKVGLYSTLFPNNAVTAGAPPGVMALKNKLLLAEAQPTNHLMLIHYSGNRPTGCYLYDDPMDKDKWNRMKIGDAFMTTFKTISPFPRKIQIDYLQKMLDLN